ncbi:MAG: alpha-glucosidase/alpha-galactosidase [Defluviitaleaceae bacterium]|nr:alpha-glucosidase/alpha-galactosidase [Defluviitaleaceae bacterium]
MKTKYNFAFIGAGSTTFTLGLVSDLLHEPDILPGGELRLVDTDPDALESAYNAVCMMVKQSGRPFAVTKHGDFREVLPGLDFIFFTFVTGKYPSWKTDIDICTKHGVLQSVGDTIGPGGIIRTIRNVPVVYEIAKEMERVCPEAWAINYSNPEGALCLAIEKYTKIRTFGLCHGTPDTVKELADEVLKVPSDRVGFRAAGVNHLTWITELTVDGKDAYPTLMEKLLKAGWDKKEPISLELFDLYGLFPAPGDRHIKEFFSCYLRERVLAEKDYQWKNADFTVLQEWRDSSLRVLDQFIKGEIGYEEYGTSGETATHFIRSLITGEKSLEMANVMNRGYIENISDGVIVEVPVFIDTFGLHPQKIGTLPEGIAGKCEAIGREYKLAVEAAITCDKKLAMQAMLMDPLVAHCDYPEQLLDELLSAYKHLLPDAWGSQIK